MQLFGFLLYTGGIFDVLYSEDRAEYLTPSTVSAFSVFPLHGASTKVHFC